MNASENKTAKREGYLFWDDYFMAVASLTAMRSKDPSSQVNVRFCPAILPQDELSASGNVISISGFTVTGWLARKVGACIVNAAKKIVGVGYNGMPHGCSDDDLPWAREADNILDTKYLYVCHAEMNAICNKNCADLIGCTIYVDLFPCNECAKLIIQTRIKEVVYLSDKYADMPNVIASKRLFDMAGVKYRQHHPALSEVVIDFNKINSSPKISDAK